MQLVLDNVGRIYTWQWAVKNVTTTIDAGECVCVLGANGCGKSTLLNLIGGVQRTTTGLVDVRDDERFGHQSTSLGRRRRMMLIHPDQPIIGGSVAVHLGAAISLHGKDQVGIEDTAAEWLEAFGIDDKVFGDKNDRVKMSRGQQAKLWLTTLFTIRPDIWLLDEPHQCGLDAHGVEVLEEEIRSHCKTGGIVFFTSQWPPHARRLANRMILLDKGEPVYVGAVDNVVQQFDSRDPRVAAILRLLESEQVEVI